MWYDLVNLIHRYPSWTIKPRSVAPARHQLALQQYLDGRQAQAGARRRHDLEIGLARPRGPLG